MTAPAAPGHRVDSLPRRADFLRAARAGRQGTPGFLLQARCRTAGEPDPQALRVGFTCSRKVGNAVVRNRARRRLRAAARAVLPAEGRPGWDYVLVGRPEATVTREFAALTEDLRRALARLHRQADRPAADQPAVDQPAVAARTAPALQATDPQTPDPAAPPPAGAVTQAAHPRGGTARR